MVQAKSMKFLNLNVLDFSSFKCPNSALMLIPVQLVDIFFSLYLWLTDLSLMLG